MKLSIKDSNKIVDVSFGLWLIPKIASVLVSHITDKRLVAWDKFLTESPDLTRLYSKPYKAGDILLFASKHLHCEGVDGNISIFFDKNITVPGFDRVNLDTILKTINYGTLQVPGTHIITDIFTDFAENIVSYVDLYYVI